jgi:hypothetical protein
MFASICIQDPTRLMQWDLNIKSGSMFVKLAFGPLCVNTVWNTSEPIYRIPPMRAVAIIFNLVQMIIVLAIFVMQGVSFGGWAILGLFLLLMIACFNLLVLLFHGFEDQHLIEKEKPTIVKRRDLRVVYPPSRAPRFMVGQRAFSILDIAESGVRISINRNESLKKRLRARVQLICGETLNVRASVVRRHGDEVALCFKQPLGYATLLKEKQVINAPQP